MSNAAHPGSTHTNLHEHGPQPRASVEGTGLIGHADARSRGVAGARRRARCPTLYAATSPDAVGSGYYGPDGFQQMNGMPVLVPVPRRALDEATAAGLWQAGEDLTGVVVPRRLSAKRPGQSVFEFPLKFWPVPVDRRKPPAGIRPRADRIGARRR